MGVAELDFFPILAPAMTHAFAPPAISSARAHIGALFSAFQAATGLAPTFIGRFAVAGDPKFARSYGEANFSFGTYDRVVSRLSAVWPPDVPWPDGVPRQAPAEIEPEMLAELAARLARIAARPAAQEADEDGR